VGILSEKHELSVMIFNQASKQDFILISLNANLTPKYVEFFVKLMQFSKLNLLIKMLTIKIDYNLLYTSKLTSVKCCLIEMI